MDRPAGSGWSSALLCERRDLEHAVCLTLTGELDLGNVSTLQTHLKSVAQTEQDLIVDLSGLRYIDSSGIKTLLDAHRNFARTNRRVVLAAPSAMTQHLFKVLSIGEIIPIFETVDAALASLRPVQS